MKPLLFTAFLMAFGCSCAQAHPFVISPPAKDYAGRVVEPPKDFSDSLAIIPPLMPFAAMLPSSLAYRNTLRLNALRLLPRDALRSDAPLYLNLRLSHPPNIHLRESWLKERRSQRERTRAVFLRRSPRQSLLNASRSPLPNLTAFKQRPSFQYPLPGRMMRRSFLGFAF